MCWEEVWEEVACMDMQCDKQSCVEVREVAWTCNLAYLRSQHKVQASNFTSWAPGASAYSMACHPSHFCAWLGRETSGQAPASIQQDTETLWSPLKIDMVLNWHSKSWHTLAAMLASIESSFLLKPEVCALASVHANDTRALALQLWDVTCMQVYPSHDEVVALELLV